MAKVRKANVLLTVNEDEVDKYLSKGFDLVDNKGNVIKDSTPTDLGQYQRAYSRQKELLEEKDKEIANLKAELQELKQAGVKKTPASKPVAEEDWDDEDYESVEEVVEEKPKKKRKARE